MPGGLRDGITKTTELSACLTIAGNGLSALLLA